MAKLYSYQSWKGANVETDQCLYCLATDGGHEDGCDGRPGLTCYDACCTLTSNGEHATDCPIASSN